MYFIRLRQETYHVDCNECDFDDEVEMDKYIRIYDNYKMLECPNCKEEMSIEIGYNDNDSILKYITDDLSFIKRLEKKESELYENKFYQSSYEILEIKNSLAMFGINDIMNIKKRPWGAPLELDLFDKGYPSPLSSYGKTEDYMIDHEYCSDAIGFDTVIDHKREDMTPEHYFDKPIWLDLREFVKNQTTSI